MEIKLFEFLHPRIIESSLPLYKNKNYDYAALDSMKQVEMALRDKGIAPKNLSGVRLVKWVLGQGERITLSVPLGDELQEYARLLFKGAFSYYRNYAAHDGANIDEKISLRVMVLASELLDLISASNRSFERIGGVEGIIKAKIFNSEQEFLDCLYFLNGQQIVEHDPSEFKLELEAKGFGEIQEEAMFDFGFVIYEEWEAPPVYEAGLNGSTLVGEIKLTSEGLKVAEELETKITNLQNGS